MRPTSISSIIALLSLMALPACGQEDCPPGYLRNNDGNCVEQGDGDTDADADADSDTDSDSDTDLTDYCYDAGWSDCEDLYMPYYAGDWGCYGSDADWYCAGYCDCEVYYFGGYVDCKSCF